MKEVTVRKMIPILGICLALLALPLGCGKGTETPTVDTVIEINGEVGLSGAIELTEGHIENLVQCMEIMAMTGEVRSGNWENMSGILSKFGQDEILAATWFALPDGSYYTVEKGKVDKNISDRPYFPKVMAGNIVVGDLVVSRSTGRKAMVATVPVKNEGEVIGALGVSVDLEKLSEIIVKELQLPDDMVFYAVNDEGEIALHRNPELLLIDTTGAGSETFANAVEYIRANREGTVAYEFNGVSEEVIFKTSSSIDWHFALGFKGK